MQNKVLFVDDEGLVLQIAAEILGEHYKVDTARSADEGLAAICIHGPYSAIVADLCMPGMGDTSFLKLAAEIAPHTPRLAVTADTDMQLVCEAVNEARVFRLLPKSCEMETLRSALDDAIAEFDRHKFDQACLDEVTDGYLSLLGSLLTAVDSEAHSRAMRVTKLAIQVGEHLGATSASNFEAAAISAEIEALPISDKNWVLKSANEILGLMPSARAKIRRSDAKHQNLGRIGATTTHTQSDEKANSETIIRAVRDLDALIEESLLPAIALQRMSQQPELYPRKVIQALRTVLGSPQREEVEKRSFSDIVPGMYLMEDVASVDGRTLVARGTKLTETMLTRLRMFANNGSIENRVLVAESETQVAV